MSATAAAAAARPEAAPPRRPGMTTRFNVVAGALLLAVGAPAYWLLYDNRPGDIAAQPLDIADLRRLAAAEPGPHPTAISGIRVAHRHRPGTMLAAGTGLKNRLLAEVSWRIDFPRSGPVVIGTGLTPAAATASGMEMFDPEAQARLDRSLLMARAIIALAPVPGQLAGLVGSRNPEVHARARLLPDQTPDKAGIAVPGWSERTRLAPPLSESGPQPIAPGVVSIPTPGMGRGTQMVYVRLADGKEYLFAGEASPLAVNWREQRARPRLVTDHLTRQDREQAYSWLRTIAHLHRQAPAMHVIPGHDINWIRSRKEGPGLPVYPLPYTQQPAGK